MAAHDEFALKAGFWNTETVNARLFETFPAPRLATASVLLAGLVGEVPEGDDEADDLASCRLMLAAIRVSEGDLARLGMWAEVARNDPRDLIAAAEYRRELGEPEGGDVAGAREADLANYLAWVSGAGGSE